MKQVRNGVWVCCGTLSVGIGLLGVFLPVLPTTPFLLLAAYCYGRGSKRLYDRLVYHSWVGSYIKNYQDGKGIPLRLKSISIALLWLTMGITIGLPVTAWWLKILLLLIATGVTLHLGKIKIHHDDSRIPMMRNNLQ
jgi:uncharacterized membrane protein YbaN (DUF454 family)